MSSHPDRPVIVRSPRFRILADSYPVGSATEVHIRSTNTYAADRYTVLFQADPNSGSGKSDYDRVAAASVIDIQVQGDSKADYHSIVAGRADTITWDYATSRLSVEGRDRSGELQDSSNNDSFVNRTSSEIAAILALRHGLIPAVVPTGTIVGRYFHGDACQVVYNQFNRIATEWDLLVYLARHENFNIFVRGSTLYFQPNISSVGSPIIINVGDTMSVRMRQRLHLMGDVSVTVKSWNVRQGSAVIQTAVSQDLSSILGTISGLSRQSFSLVQPNLTPGDAAALAIRRAEELSRHAQCLELSMPGELKLAPRDRFFLSGTQSVFSQVYQVDSIERVLSSTSGFTQRVSAHCFDNRRVQLTAEDIPINGPSI